MLDNEAYWRTHTLRICNAYFFSTTIMVRWRHLNVTFTCTLPLLFNNMLMEIMVLKYAFYCLGDEWRTSSMHARSSTRKEFVLPLRVSEAPPYFHIEKKVTGSQMPPRNIHSLPMRINWTDPNKIIYTIVKICDLYCYL